jgi:hypothetical protein
MLEPRLPIALQNQFPVEQNIAPALYLVARPFVRPWDEAGQAAVRRAVSPRTMRWTPSS